ncbi:MAG: hypothetical protein WDO74_00065 [Pseudomonadota bacterium]
MLVMLVFAIGFGNFAGCLGRIQDVGQGLGNRAQTERVDIHQVEDHA